MCNICNILFSDIQSPFLAKLGQICLKFNENYLCMLTQLIVDQYQGAIIFFVKKIENNFSLSFNLILNQIIKKYFFHHVKVEEE